MLLSRIEIWINPQFKNLLNQNAYVVAEDFQQDFVLLGELVLAPYIIPELGLYHVKNRFRIASLVFRMVA
jgi:hypothetical protein